jgi:hypothetical protein
MMMDGLIVAVVGVGIAIVGVVIYMMFWVRNEANKMRKIQHEDRKDTIGMIQAIQQVLVEMQGEMKNFHYRLLEIEKNRK